MRDKTIPIWLRRLAALSVVASSFVAVGGPIPEYVPLAVTLAAIYVLWRSVERFWRGVAGGLIGGVVAGVLILGPGFRLAMRAVAVMDPFRSPEFSIGGTLLIVIGIGAIMGAIAGSTFQVFRRAWPINSAVFGGGILALVEMISLVFFSGELSEEFFSLGISPWINIPMFGVVMLGFGVAAMAMADLAEQKMFPKRHTTAHAATMVGSSEVHT